MQKTLVISWVSLLLTACASTKPFPNATSADAATVTVKSSFQEANILRLDEQMWVFVSKRSSQGEPQIIGQFLLTKETPSHTIKLEPNAEYGFGFNVMERIPFQEKDCLMGVGVKVDANQRYVVAAQYPREISSQVFSGCTVAAFHASNLDSPITVHEGELRVRNVQYVTDIKYMLPQQVVPARRVQTEPLTGR